MNNKPNYVFYATVLRIVDADTIDLLIDCGFNIMRKERIRIARIDAWETRGEERVKGLEAKKYVESLMPVGTEVMVQTGKMKGKYGRYIGEVSVDGENLLSDLLVENGHAVHVDW